MQNKKGYKACPENAKQVDKNKRKLVLEKSDDAEEQRKV